MISVHNHFVVNCTEDKYINWMLKEIFNLFSLPLFEKGWSVLWGQVKKKNQQNLRCFADMPQRER